MTVVKTYLKAISTPDLHVFATAVVGRKPSAPESYEDSVIIDPPFSIKSENKTLEVFRFGPAANAPLAGENMQKAHKLTNQLWWSR